MGGDLFVIELVAVAVGLSLLFFSALLAIEVFIKRNRRGQTPGFIFSLLAVPLYLIAFCDRLPNRPVGLRDVILILPGVTKAASHFNSSILILFALAATCALRFAIHVRLFIIPALTLTAEKYSRQNNVRQRANDLTSPVLAYFTFALALTALIAGASALPAFAGVGIMLCLVAVYLFSPFFRGLAFFQWLVIETRIAVRRLGLLGSTVVVYVIVGIGKLEGWHRRQAPSGDQQFLDRLEKSLLTSRRKALASIEREQELLRSLALKQEEPVLQGAPRWVSKPTRSGHSSSPSMSLAEGSLPADSMQLTIYAEVEEDTEEWRRLSNAGAAVAEALGYVLESQLPTEYGSVFQRGFWKRIVTSEEARQYEAMLQQALGLKVAMLNQAEVDSKQAGAAAALIAALAAVPTACVKVGSLLVIKYRDSPNADPVVLVRSLSSREIQAIDHYPAILKHPHTALDALNMAIAAEEPSETTSNEPGPE